MALRNRKLPRHILVIRNSAMGDVAMVPHALRALREAYPDVRVTVLTRPLFKPFFAGLDVDFLEADYAGRHKGVLGLLRLAGEARRRGIDAVADMHGVLRSRIVGLLLRLHGMPAARIDKGRIEKWFRLGCTNPAASPLKHTVVRYCDVLRRLGFVFDDPQPAAKPVRPNPFGEKKGVWIGFAPFSAQAGKTYPEDLAAGARTSQCHGALGARPFCRRAGSDRQSRLCRLDGLAGDAHGLAGGHARRIGVGRHASRAGLSGLRLSAGGGGAARPAVSSLFGLRTAALQVRRLPLYAHSAAGRSRPCGGVLVDPSGGGSRPLRPAGSIASCRKIMIL